MVAVVVAHMSVTIPARQLEHHAIEIPARSCCGCPAALLLAGGVLLGPLFPMDGDYSVVLVVVVVVANEAGCALVGVGS